MYNVSIRDIYRICSPEIIYRGKHYFNQKSVNICDTKMIEDRLKVSAKVKGSREYTTSVSFDQTGEIVALGCSCPYFSQYLEPCKHVAALMFELEENDVPPPPLGAHYTGKNQQLTNYLIDYFSQPIVEDKRKEVNVEFHLSVNSTSYFYKLTKLSLEIKVGVDRLYVVKDIGNLLQSINLQRPHKFTSKFTLDFGQHKFKQSDDELLQLLQNIEENNQALSNSYYYKASSDRTITIPPVCNQQLLQLLEQCQKVIVNNGFPFKVKTNEFPGTFSIEKKGDISIYNDIKNNTK
ncbi:MAG: SWIM zinc finger family protein [Bacillaceae bacterium]|nr:SWIM zinc finger family protein [Bacillaceae bacterium]